MTDRQFHWFSGLTLAGIVGMAAQCTFACLYISRGQQWQEIAWFVSLPACVIGGLSAPLYRLALAWKLVRSVPAITGMDNS